MNKARYILAHNLERLIDSLGVSKRQLAEDTGIGRPSLDGYLKATIDPGLDSLTRLADFFHTPVHNLVDEEMIWPWVKPTESRRITPEQALEVLREAIAGPTRSRIPEDIRAQLEIIQHPSDWEAIRALIEGMVIEGERSEPSKKSHDLAKPSNKRKK